VSNRVHIVEVGPRDGFQMESRFIPTELKAAVIDQLSASGISKLEAASFVNAKVIPQMADAAEVMQRFRRKPGVVYSGLVPNLRGAERAIEARVDAVRVVVCITEPYNRRNAGMSVAESAEVCAEILKLAKTAGVAAEVAIGVAFGCPLEGEVPEQKVLDFVGQMAETGYREISLADSVGLANPMQIRQMVRRARAQFPDVRFSLHLHNTRGLGLANVLAGLEEGIDTFDSSLGGLGGCPVVPGATGNIATEDLVNMLHEMGFTTGVDIDGVMAASRLVANFLERRLPSYVLSAGTREQLYRAIGARRQVSTTS
jgi:hydroxymethylglutaryl-CoA lyase